MFIRSNEQRFARWSEIDFSNRIWTIPSPREAIAGVRYSGRGAKMRTPHIVPLSEQAITTLKRIKVMSGEYEQVFPGDHTPYKPMCENTVNMALRLMGYDTKQDICGHGFRAMACSALTEFGLCTQDRVERQMSHQERNTVSLTYIIALTELIKVIALPKLALFLLSYIKPLKCPQCGRFSRPVRMPCFWLWS